MFCELVVVDVVLVVFVSYGFEVVVVVGCVVVVGEWLLCVVV